MARRKQDERRQGDSMERRRNEDVVAIYRALGPLV